MDDQSQNKNNTYPAEPAVPVGSPNKEVPIINASAEMSISAESQVNVSRELKDIGVKEVSEHQNLAPDIIKAGLTHSPGIVQPNLNSVSDPNLDENKANHVLKTEKNPQNSILWKFTLIFRQIKIAHLRMLKG